MRISGYAAIFDVPDRGGDVIRRGAFDDCLCGPSPVVPFCWEHQRDTQIGYVDQIYADDRGLRVEIELDPTFVGYAKLLDLLARDALAFSFGYRVRRSAALDQFRELLEVNLVEISLVTFPMQPLARVDRPWAALLEFAA